MENLNAEQVKKALEYCSNHDECVGEVCPYYTTSCEKNMPKDALALINSQEQRIKELAEENEGLRSENDSLAISEVKECEISQMLVYRIRDKHPAVMAVIADTVRKVLHFVKERADSCDIIPIGSIRPIDTIYQISNTELEEIAKEMLEGVCENTTN